MSLLSLLEAKKAKDKGDAQKEEAREAFGVRDYFGAQSPTHLQPLCLFEALCRV